MTPMPPPTQETLRPSGERRVRFLELLGQGGFGAVYRAEVRTDSGLVQHVAIKVLSMDMTAHADLAARQRDEARLLSRLRHHAIVTVFDLTELAGRPAVVMELVEGVDASDLRAAGVLSPRASLQIIAETAGALDAAWSTPDPETGRPLRVVHRDIKPANLLVSRHGSVKVLDFGVARADFEREGITGSVQFGTARYMAPEQWLTGTASHPVDVYALGISLVELLTGEPLARAPLQPERFHAHIDAAAEAAGRVAGSAAVADFIRDLLAFDPADRLTAAEARDRALTLADAAPGAQLARLAPAVVPGQMDARRTRLAGRLLPGSLPLGAASGAQASDVDPAAPPPLPAHLRDARSVSPVTPSERHRNSRKDDSRFTMDLSVPIDAQTEDARTAPKSSRTCMYAFAASVLLLLGVGVATWMTAKTPAPAEEPTSTETVGEPPAAAESGPTREADDAAELARETSAPAPEQSDARGEQTEPAPTPVRAEPARPAPARPAIGSKTETRTPREASAPSTPAPVEKATFPVTLTSDPLGATVWVDGTELGMTPILDSPLPEGDHTVRMVFGDARIEGRLRIRRMRAPTMVKWDVDSDRLSMQ